ncbi:MAG: glycosyltransferase family 39 protein [Actinomycetota bacterium]|nr:glycosyltransferase family 39 protein [Actinomycetota bacterium]
MGQHDSGTDPGAAPPLFDRRLAAILALALALRVALLLVALGNQARFDSTDVPEYLRLARDLDGAYADPDDPLFGVGLKRTPLYPVFLAAVLALSGRNLEWATLLTGIAASVATVWVTFVLAQDLFDRAAGYAGALLLAVDPASVVWSNFLQPEALFTLLLASGVVLWYRAQRRASPRLAAAAGLLVGAAVLTRPIGLYLALVLVAVGWLVAKADLRRRVVLALAFLAVAALPPAGWVARNAAVTGVPLLSTVESLNLLHYRAAGAVAEEQDISLNRARLRLQQQLDARTAPGDNPAEVARVRSALGIRTLLDHPAGAAVTWVKGAGRMLFGPARAPLLILLGEQDPVALDSPRKVAWVALQWAILAVLYACALAGAVIAVRRRRWAALAVLGALIAYFVLVSSGTEAFSRFRVPMVPYVAALGGCGAASVAARFARR